MAIADYPSLQTEISVWLARTDSVITARVPTFIEAADARIYDGGDEPGSELYTPPLRTTAMETIATVTMTDGVGALPSDHLETRRLLVSGGTIGLTFLAPERFAEMAAVAGAGGPYYHTVEAGSLKVYPAYTGDLSLSYYARYPVLSVDAPTNPIATAHGAIYLAGALFEAFTFLQKMDLALGHLAKMRSLIKGANATAQAQRFAGPLRVRSRLALP